MDPDMNHIPSGPQFGEDWFSGEGIYRRMVRNCRPDGKLVEVGCWRGRSTAFLLVEAYNHSPKIEVFAVDTWEGSPEHADHPCVQSGTLFENFMSNVAPVAERLTPLKMPSLQAADLFADGSLDAVFIDAAHEYEPVKADILAWRPKVRRGGILAGHDFGAGWPGVDLAVTEIFGQVEAGEFCWLVTLT
jgi:predicted O-methyltransferase YrrM